MVNGAPDLQPHDILISEGPQFNQRGGVDVLRRVQFFIGDHGPFVLSDFKQHLDAARIRAEILKHVEEIRTALDLEGQV